MLDHVFSVFILPAPWCHNCTSPPVKGAHPGKGICATSRFILVSAFAQLPMTTNLRKYMLSSEVGTPSIPKMPCATQTRSFSQSSVLKLSGFKRSCFSYSRPLISHHFPKKMDPLRKRRRWRIFANRLPILHHKELESKTSKYCPVRVGKMSMQLFRILDFSLVLLWT